MNNYQWVILGFTPNPLKGVKPRTTIPQTMAFIDNLKQLFGLGTYPADAQSPAPVTNVPAPNPSGMPTTPRQREQLYRFMVEKLAAYSNEKDGLPTGLKL